jgi:hypothetical protein
VDGKTVTQSAFLSGRFGHSAARGRRMPAHPEPGDRLLEVNERIREFRPVKESAHEVDQLPR